MDECYDTTWTDTAGSNENQPVNCLDWYTAFAFCAWDGDGWRPKPSGTTRLRGKRTAVLSVVEPGNIYDNRCQLRSLRQHRSTERRLEVSGRRREVGAVRLGRERGGVDVGLVCKPVLNAVR